MDYTYFNPVTIARPKAVDEVTINMVVFAHEVRKVPAGAIRITATEGPLWVSSGVQDIIIAQGETMALIPGRHIYVSGNSSTATAVKLHFQHF